MTKFSRRSISSLALATALIGAMAVPAMAQGPSGAATGAPAARAGDVAKPSGSAAATPATPAGKPAATQTGATQNGGKPAAAATTAAGGHGAATAPAAGQGTTRTN